jgi:hypothetical protein
LLLADLLHNDLLDHLLHSHGLYLLDVLLDVLLDELPLHNHLLDNRLNVLDGLNELDRLDNGLHVLDLLLNGHNGSDDVVSGPHGERKEGDGHKGEEELDTHGTRLRDLTFTGLERTIQSTQAKGESYEHTV